MELPPSVESLLEGRTTCDYDLFGVGRVSEEGEVVIGSEESKGVFGVWGGGLEEGGNEGE